MTTESRMGSSCWCLLVSVGLHAGLAAWLYHVGNVEIVRRQDTEVAASVQATAQAMQTRLAKRVDDLKKIKELLEQSANRAPEAAPDPPALARTVTEPARMLEQARALSRSIDELGRELKAQELARLTDRKMEEVREELDAAGPPDSSSRELEGSDPAAELAALETKARTVLASRAEQLAREQNGVQVKVQASGGGDRMASDANGNGNGIGTGKASGQGSTLGELAAGASRLTAEEIARFIDGGKEAERDWTSRLYRQDSRDIFASGEGDILRFDTTRMVKGRGRLIGPGGQYANRIYINSWYIIGPFQGSHGAGLFKNPKYAPEDAVLLDAKYHGKDKRIVQWKYVNKASYPLVPHVVEENAVYYGYTEVAMDQERDMLVWIGADDDVSVRVNDRLVWKGGNTSKRWFYERIYTGRTTYERDYNRTEGQRLVRFRKGRNTIFFKLSNGPTRLFFSMVLTPAK